MEGSGIAYWVLGVLFTGWLVLSTVKQRFGWQRLVCASPAFNRSTHKELASGTAEHWAEGVKWLPATDLLRSTINAVRSYAFHTEHNREISVTQTSSL